MSTAGSRAEDLPSLLRGDFSRSSIIAEIWVEREEGGKGRGRAGEVEGELVRVGCQKARA